MVRFGLRQHPSEASVKVYQDPACFGCFRKKITSVWFGLFWLCMIRFDLRQHPSEASVNVSSRSDYFWMF